MLYRDRIPWLSRTASPPGLPFRFSAWSLHRRPDAVVREQAPFPQLQPLQRRVNMKLSARSLGTGICRNATGPVGTPQDSIRNFDRQSQVLWLHEMLMLDVSIAQMKP